MPDSGEGVKKAWGGQQEQDCREEFGRGLVWRKKDRIKARESQEPAPCPGAGEQ